MLIVADELNYTIMDKNLLRKNLLQIKRVKFFPERTLLFFLFEVNLNFFLKEKYFYNTLCQYIINRKHPRVYDF